MSVIIFYVIIFALALLAGSVLLLASGVLGLGLGWLLGIGLVPGMGISMGALGVAAILFHAGLSHHSLSPFASLRRLFDEYESTYGGDTDLASDEDEDAEEPPAEIAPSGGWLTPCPCRSGRPFAQCCGRRAFRKRTR
jgi:hypothetical protein